MFCVMAKNYVSFHVSRNIFFLCSLNLKNYKIIDGNTIGERIKYDKKIHKEFL